MLVSERVLQSTFNWIVQSPIWSNQPGVLTLPTYVRDEIAPRFRKFHLPVPLILSAGKWLLPVSNNLLLPNLLSHLSMSFPIVSSSFILTTWRQKMEDKLIRKKDLKEEVFTTKKRKISILERIMKSQVTGGNWRSQFNTAISCYNYKVIEGTES